MEFKIAELKGFQHPDTITDNIVEALTRVVEDYEKKTNTFIHYNLDKALFVGGNAIITFDEYKLLKNPLLIISGNISCMDKELIYMMEDCARQYAECMMNGMEIDIEFRLASTSPGLNKISGQVLAGDTSYGVAHYPLFDYEEMVLDIDKKLRTYKFENRTIGGDWKIMYRKNEDCPVPVINISVPFLIDKVTNAEKAWEVRDNLIYYLSDNYPAIFNVNSDMQSFGNIWLLKYGTSLEVGDCGQVGRGNRYNGLINPMCAMTMEAFHGKNNKNHSGKYLQIEAEKIAKELYEKDGNRYLVILVSKIGRVMSDYEKYFKIIN